MAVTELNTEIQVEKELGSEIDVGCCDTAVV